MITAAQREALRVLYDRLRHMEEPWAITGSLGFALHGMEVSVHDIDLQTSREGAYRIQGLFQQHITREVRLSEAPGIRSYFGELSIEETRVEIMGALQKRLPSGDWEPPVEVEQHREFLAFEDMRLPVLMLEYEESAYRRLGRSDRADDIRRWLDDRA